RARRMQIAFIFIRRMSGTTFCPPWERLHCVANVCVSLVLVGLACKTHRRGWSQKENSASLRVATLSRPRFSLIRGVITFAAKNAKFGGRAARIHLEH